jgi:DNA-binding transcriptional ArsR family regulator
MAAKPARYDGPEDMADGSTPVPLPAGAAALDRVIHERMRLAILSALAGRDAMSFAELKALTGATDGNLSVHARRLEDAGYVICTKAFAGRVPRTDYHITTAGQRALREYLDHMEALIQQVRAS